MKMRSGSMSSKNIATLLITALLLLISVEANQLDVRFLGNPNHESTYLMWEVRHWPSEVSGFKIKRQTKLGDWRPLHNHVIKPGYIYSRQWSQLGVHGSRLPKVIERVDANTLNGAELLPPERALEQIWQNGAVPTGTLIAMSRDYNNALAVGFGFIDNDVVSGRDYSYALVSVDNKGKESSEPVAEYHTADYHRNKDGVVSNLSISQEDTKVKLSWELADEHYDTVCIFGFYIYHINNESGKRRLLNPGSPLWGKRVADGKIDFSFFHAIGADPDDYTFEVEPVTVFQEHLPAKAISFSRLIDI